jgi:uncharacterized protein
VWLVVIPLTSSSAAVNVFLPSFASPENQGLGAFLDSGAGQTFLSGNWVWFAVVAVPLLFAVFGEGSCCSAGSCCRG